MAVWFNLVISGARTGDDSLRKPCALLDRTVVFCLSRAAIVGGGILLDAGVVGGSVCLLRVAPLQLQVSVSLWLAVAAVRLD